MTDLPRKVLVTYSEEYGGWATLAPELKRHLPLSNIVWKSPIAAQRDTRVISELDMEFKKFSIDVFPKNDPASNLSQTPYLHLYLVVCEDVEVYRNTVRKALQEWIATITSKRNQEYLILYLTSDKTLTGNFFKSTVFDKLKSDFDIKKERVVGLQQTGPKEFRDPENWRILFSKMVECIITSFNGHIVQYDEMCRRMESQRLVPGWNYFQFFILREGLAQAYENMGLPEEALMQYEQLELGYFQTLREQEMTWFKSFGGTDPGDDSADIFNLRRKDYREKIAKSTISTFDFRIYLNARQCLLLLKMKKPVDVLVKAKNFITAFSRSLKENETSLIPNFRVSWIYTSCIGVLAQTEELVAVSQFPSEVLAWYHARKGEILHFARLQVDKVGLICKYLPSDLGGLIPSDDVSHYSEPGFSRSSLTGISNDDLRLAASTLDSFDKLYQSITERALKSFELGQRPRAVTLMKSDLGLLQSARKKHKEALEILLPIGSQFHHAGWWRLAVWIWTHLLPDLAAVEDKETLLDLCMQILKEADATVALEGVAQQWYQVAQTVSKLERSSKGFVDIKVESIDGDDMCATIESHVKTNVKLDEVVIAIIGPDSKELLFEIKEATLKPGINRLILQNKNPLPIIPGKWVAEDTIVKVGNLILEQNLLDANHDKQTLTVEPREVSTWIEALYLNDELVLCAYLPHEMDQIILIVDDLHYKSILDAPKVQNDAGEFLSVDHSEHEYAWKNSSLFYFMQWNVQKNFSLANLHPTILPLQESYLVQVNRIENYLKCTKEALNVPGMHLQKVDLTNVSKCPIRFNKMNYPESCLDTEVILLPGESLTVVGTGETLSITTSLVQLELFSHWSRQSQRLEPLLSHLNKLDWKTCLENGVIPLPPDTLSVDDLKPVWFSFTLAI